MSIEQQLVYYRDEVVRLGQEAADLNAQFVEEQKSWAAELDKAGKVIDEQNELLVHRAIELAKAQLSIKAKFDENNLLRDLVNRVNDGHDPNNDTYELLQVRKQVIVALDGYMSAEAIEESSTFELVRLLQNALELARKTAGGVKGPMLLVTKTSTDGDPAEKICRPVFDKAIKMLRAIADNLKPTDPVGSRALKIVASCFEESVTP
jgi:hypothetical protein